MADSREKKGIPELFKGKCILITGATGFLGKVLVEKLLRSCPDIKEILVLLRSTKDGCPEKRLQELKEHKVFDRLRVECAAALKKVRALPGDIVAENLGLESTHLQRVIEDVAFVFHCAANVRFDDKPSATLSINLLGVHYLLDVCRMMANLEALVHVSTAFSFCNNPIIDEFLYPEVVNPDNLINSLSWMTDEQLRLVCEYYQHGRPSLYHFSKAMAEILISQGKLNFPVVIVRPSIVTAAVKEPFPGWIDNYNGPSGFIAVCGKGVMKTLLVNEGVYADWVPVDTVVNTIIVAAHHLATKRDLAASKLQQNCSSNVPIINCICPDTNLITWMKVVKLCLPFLVKYPSSVVLSRPGGTVTSSYLRYKMCQIFSHNLPAYLTDAFLFLTWRKPRLVKMYRRIHGVMAHLQHYTTHSFQFRSNNMKKLVETLDPEDADVFPIDQNELNWKEYIEDYVLGVRRYFLLESDDTLQTSRRKMLIYHYMWLAIKCASLLGLCFALRRCGILKLRSIWIQHFPIFPAFKVLHKKLGSIAKKIQYSPFLST